MPLAGVPIAVKDNVAVAGEVCTDGAAALDRHPETRNAEVVTRLRRAGAVVVGVTRVPELCLYAATDGPGTVTRNPWDTARSPAGSSGGSAAAVAAGAVPLAQGNDGMGSLRLPAAACGLVRAGGGGEPPAAVLRAAGHPVLPRAPLIPPAAAAAAVARWLAGADADA